MDEEEDLPSDGKRKGMQPLSSIPSSILSPYGPSTLQCKRLRGHQSMQALTTRSSLASIRESSTSSVTAALSRLHIDREVSPSERSEHRAISSSMKPPPSRKLRHQPSINTGMRNLRIDSTESALVLFEPQGDSLVASKTPSHIPVLRKQDSMTFASVTPCKTPKQTPQKTPYLTKDSKLTSFTAWDVHGRIEDMEAMFYEMKDKMTNTNIERNSLEEVVAIYKARGKH